MAAVDPALERDALVRSIAATALLGGLGIVWGIASGSQMILFDGVFALVGIAVSWLLLRASALAEQGPSRHYPFGREGATPLVIGIQGFVLLATLLYAMVESVGVIRAGGTELTPGFALLYGVITALASLAVTAWLRRRADGSDIVAAEATAWGVAAWRGVGMVVGFGAMWALEGTGWDAAVPYIDPAMVLVTCAVFLPAPTTMVRTTVVELLEGAPTPSVQAAVDDAVATTSADVGLPAPVATRTTKLGTKLYVEIDLLVTDDTTVRQVDAYRSSVRRRLADLPYDVWLNVDPSTDPSWGRDESGERTGAG
ncbi:MAG TPA: cation transporter [Acidimicrobiales bacterium]|nr:cation transporter [Acidimicrobiales bacterium]